MPQTWHEVQLASYVPEAVRAIIGTTPVYRAGKVEIVAGRIICIYGILVAVLAVIFVGIGIGEMAKTGWSELLVRVGLGLALGWVAWLILSYWHRQRQLRLACEREYRQHGILCTGRVVFCELRNPRDETSHFFLYYQFHPDFIIQEAMDDLNPRHSMNVGESVPISYLPQNPRLARIIVWK